MKNVFLLMMLMALTGCTSYMSSLKMAYDVQEQPLLLVDNRPEIQKEHTIMSLNVSNCAYGSYQIGDDQQKPSRLVFLRNYLSHELGDTLKGSTASIKSFTLHVNASAQLKGGLAAMHGPLYQLLGNPKVFGCARDDLQGGYTTAELKDEFPPLIAVIDVEINGKVYHARALESLEQNAWGQENPRWEAKVQAVLTAVSSQLVERIRNGDGMAVENL